MTGTRKAYCKSRHGKISSFPPTIGIAVFPSFLSHSLTQSLLILHPRFHTNLTCNFEGAKPSLSITITTLFFALAWRRRQPAGNWRTTSTRRSNRQYCATLTEGEWGQNTNTEHTFNYAGCPMPQFWHNLHGILASLSHINTEHSVTNVSVLGIILFPCWNCVKLPSAL